jgi:hypothetical protein
MRYLIYFVTAAFALGAAVAQGQTPTMKTSTQTPIVSYDSYGGYPYGYSYSSTIAEGAARGLADVIRSQGDYNLSTSAAAINWNNAWDHAIDNQKKAVQAYFDIREVNRTIHDAEQRRLRGGPESWKRSAQAGVPRRLASNELDSVTGRIYWPVLLTGQNFRSHRVELEKAFAERAYFGSMAAEPYLRTLQLTDDLLASLKSRVRELPPDQYVAATRFLQSLAFEASQPSG